MNSTPNSLNTQKIVPISARQTKLRKLSSAQVVLLRQMHKEAFPRRFLCALFGISHTAYLHITRRSTYKDVR